VQVSVGVWAACGLHADGSVRCWCCDNDLYEEICAEAPPEPMFDRVEVGHAMACARDRDSGVLSCWGELEDPQDQPTDPVIDFAIESSYAVAVRADGSLQDWGYDDPWRGQLPPAGVRFVDVGAGRSHACGVDDQGRAYCWGEGFFGGPIGDAPYGTFSQVESFNQVSAFVSPDGDVSLVFGAVLGGLETWAAQLPPEPIGVLGFGEWDGCGITWYGEAYCWGGDPAAEPWLDVPRLP
jgi:hypothetical protein